MSIAARFAILALISSVCSAQYTYYHSVPTVSQSSWQTSGEVNSWNGAGSCQLAVDSNTAVLNSVTGAACVSSAGIPDGTSEYEVKAVLNYGSSSNSWSSTTRIYLRANSSTVF